MSWLLVLRATGGTITKRLGLDGDSCWTGISNSILGFRYPANLCALTHIREHRCRHSSLDKLTMPKGHAQEPSSLENKLAASILAVM